MTKALAFLQSAATTLSANEHIGVAMNSWQGFEAAVLWLARAHSVTAPPNSTKSKHIHHIFAAVHADLGSRDLLFQLWELRNADAYGNRLTRTRRAQGLHYGLSDAQGAFGISADTLSVIASRFAPGVCADVEHARSCAQATPPLLLSLDSLERDVLRGDFLPGLDHQLDSYLRRYDRILQASELPLARRVVLLAAQRAVHRGSFTEALQLAARGLELHRQVHDPFRKHHLEKIRVVSYRHIGDLDAATEVLKASEHHAGGHRLYLHEVNSQRVLLQAARGDVAGAIRGARQLVREGSDLGGTRLRAARLVTLGTLLTRAGHLDEAEDLFNAARARASVDDYIRQLFAYRGLLRVAKARQDLDNIYGYAIDIRRVAGPRKMWRHYVESEEVLGRVNPREEDNVND